MKLNLHPKEFLALYNMIQRQPHLEGKEVDDVALHEVHNRMRACLISALLHRRDDDDDIMFDAWEQSQRKKIEELTIQNNELKSAAKDPKAFLNKDHILTLENHELDSEELKYPRGRATTKPGRHTGHKK